MADNIEIEPMNRPGRFLNLQRSFYRGDPQYVPPLTLGERWQLDPAKNPFFRHGEAEFLVARRAGRPREAHRPRSHAGSSDRADGEGAGRISLRRHQFQYLLSPASDGRP